MCLERSSSTDPTRSDANSFASLREIDIKPLLSTLDEDEEEVRAVISHKRTMLALAELQRKMEDAISAGDFDLATYLDLRLNAEGKID